MKTFTLIIGTGKKKSKYDVDPTLISRIEITHQYESVCLPFFVVTLTLPTSVYRTLTKPENAASITANINLQKGKFSDVLSVDTESLVSFRDAIKGKFHVVLGPRAQDLSEEAQKRAETDEETYGQYASITMSLYSKLYFDTYDMVINGNIESVGLTDVIVNCLNKAKIKEILISPPDNHKIYSQFIITPLPLYEQLYRICNIYAYHKKGTIIYFDLDRGYIISAINKCTAYEPNEYKTTHIVLPNDSQVLNQIGGGYENSKDKYYVLNGLRVSLKNPDDPAVEVISINSKGKATKLNKKSKRTTKVLVQTEGESVANSYKSRILESRRCLEIPFRNIDILALTPNKMFTLSAEKNSKKLKYKGNYRLSACTHVFEKEGNYFTVTTVANFK